MYSFFVALDIGDTVGLWRKLNIISNIQENKPHKSLNSTKIKQHEQCILNFATSCNECSEHNV